MLFHYLCLCSSRFVWWIQRKRKRCWRRSLGGWTNLRMTHYLKWTSTKKRWVVLYTLSCVYCWCLSPPFSFPLSLSLQFKFQNVRFMIPQEQRLVVTNTGRRLVHVSFIPKLDEKNICKPWLEVKPQSAVIQPCKWAKIHIYTCSHTMRLCVSLTYAWTWYGHCHTDNIHDLCMQTDQVMLVCITRCPNTYICIIVFVLIMQENSLLGFS